MASAAQGDRAAALAPRVARAAAERRDALVKRLAELTALDAPSGDAAALKRVATLIEPWLVELGARVTHHEGPAGPHLEAELGVASGEGETLVLCHYDTVWPTGTVAARSFRVEDDVAYGPGVVDMRGGIVATLGALAILRDLGVLELPVRVLITADEETGSRTSRELIESRARDARIVLVPEPALAGGDIKTRRKGWISYRLAVTGRAAHAGLEPEAGVSAIHELVDLLVEIRELANPRSGTTINVGRIRGGSGVNVVAESAEAEIDVRVPDAVEERRVRAALAGLRPELPGAELTLEETHSRPPLERTPAIAAAANRARELGALLGLEFGEGEAGGVSDGNIAAAEGVPVLDGLGPEGGGAHAVHEHVNLRSLLERTALIALLLVYPAAMRD